VNRAAVYARVSTEDQLALNQLRAVADWSRREGLVVLARDLYVDIGSGASVNRPAYQRLLDDIRARRVRTVLATKIDRLGRSLLDLLAFYEECDRRGVEIRLTDQPGVENRGPLGRLLLQVLGAVAEFERQLIADRTRSGLARAKAAGSRLGRPKGRTFDAVEAQRLRDLGLGVRAIGERLGVSKSAVAAATTVRENGPPTALSKGRARKGGPGN
jgi:putative DNA-invertase from lambdoid prophage Rac